VQYLTPRKRIHPHAGEIHKQWVEFRQRRLPGDSGYVACSFHNSHDPDVDSLFYRQLSGSSIPHQYSTPRQCTHAQAGEIH